MLEQHVLLLPPFCRLKRRSLRWGEGRVVEQGEQVHRGWRRGRRNGCEPRGIHMPRGLVDIRAVCGLGIGRQARRGRMDDVQQLSDRVRRRLRSRSHQVIVMSASRQRPIVAFGRDRLGFVARSRRGEVCGGECFVGRRTLRRRYAVAAGDRRGVYICRSTIRLAADVRNSVATHTMLQGPPLERSQTRCLTHRPPRSGRREASWGALALRRRTSSGGHGSLHQDPATGLRLDDLVVPETSWSLMLR